MAIESFGEGVSAALTTEVGGINAIGALGVVAAVAAVAWGMKKMYQGVVGKN